VLVHAIVSHFSHEPIKQTMCALLKAAGATRTLAKFQLHNHKIFHSALAVSMLA
jgi:hypothetical protein